MTRKTIERLEALYGAAQRAGSATVPVYVGEMMDLLAMARAALTVSEYAHERIARCRTEERKFGGVSTIAIEAATERRAWQTVADLIADAAARGGDGR